MLQSSMDENHLFGLFFIFLKKFAEDPNIWGFSIGIGNEGENNHY